MKHQFLFSLSLPKRIVELMSIDCKPICYESILFIKKSLYANVDCIFIIKQKKKSKNKLIVLL